jgi:AcrR family transcriptional regulator
MPRINAPSIAEHVAFQETAIIAAAAELFAERGMAGTDIGDIATKVGLARSSLYRYFPDKQHILLRWFEREMLPVMERSNEILRGPGPVAERLDAWVDYQLDEMAKPEHDILMRLAEETAATSPDLRAAIVEGHQTMYMTLGTLMDEALEAHRPKNARHRDPAMVTRLLGGVITAAARTIRDGAQPSAVHAEARRCLRAILHG